ncbi:helix-turn-helix transcriptional regulator [Sphaerisporangium siamense]|uniref:DNA-binding CsgD family transcriptional regulator/tetratricopeptide (TPR) repeat protein n=1 Tax=Sphaerisporangium siamense TaxID=795645 RepID=A0A7W7D1X9_9ACTN|nr:LuxR family transcriptional regulator [Sphaerisporangium siamense]MBB4698805.1 DNA-binding CsgD family transcriptional regulator/tetratricopeptide (TPR) repeat protein [Sphaerisporangium siamense]
MRGREPEWHIVTRLLREARNGGGGTLLVEGEPGTGKSLLLSEAAAHASRQGLVPVTGEAERLGEFVPLAPLLKALDEQPAREFLEDDDAPAEWRDPRLHLLERLRTRLEMRASTRPVLVALDDLQWADRDTLAALRTLHWELAGAPVVWLLARGTGACRPGPGGAHDEARRLFDVLERHGAARVVLGPLTGADVAAVAEDLLGAAPGPDVLALAAQAGGNPFLLTELLAGLLEEGAVEIAGGRARLLSAEPPGRVHAVVRGMLDGLDCDTRRLVETAAVLGRSFTAEDAAELMGTTPATLLPAFEEALEEGVLTTAGETLEFRHELVWRAVVAGLPASLRTALHHQIGEILLDRGGSAVRAASHLVEGTRPGDVRTLGGLDRAVREVLGSSPGAAADLAVQAVRLSDPADPSRTARVVTAIQATAEAGRLDEAERLARAALAGPVSGEAAAAVRCGLACALFMDGRAGQAVAEARAALREPGLPAHLRDRATLALLCGLAGEPGAREAETEAEAILTAAERHGDTLVVGALTALATIRWESGHLADGLHLAREAVRHATTPDTGERDPRQGGRAAADGTGRDPRADGPGGGSSFGERLACPRLTLASMLADARRLDEARTLLAEAGEEAGSDAWAGPAAVRARVELIAGHLDEAAARARAALDLSRGRGAFGALASSVIAAVSLRRGDLRAAAAHTAPEQGHAPATPGETAPARCALIAGQVAEARDGPAAAVRLVAHLYADAGQARRALVADPDAASWLARTALAAGDRPRAEAAVTVAEELAAGNPGFPAVGAAARHARGLLDGDPDALAAAGEEGADPWARASAAEDLGEALAARGDRQAAVRGLDRALSCYEGSGSVRDAARVRRRLRRMGVRHRHWATSDRPVSGWGSLTDTERAVARLVTQGWTNRQVADQMFISAHTVAFHLRQIFRKLGIGSRVELTRLALEHARTGSEDTAHG